MAVGGDARRLGSPQSDEMKIFDARRKLGPAHTILWASSHPDTLYSPQHLPTYIYLACTCALGCDFCILTLRNYLQICQWRHDN
jgi:hypothetical protein